MLESATYSFGILEDFKNLKKKKRREEKKKI